MIGSRVVGIVPVTDYQGRKIDEFTSEPDIVDCIEGKVDYNLLDKYKRNPIIMPKPVIIMILNL